MARKKTKEKENRNLVVYDEDLGNQIISMNISGADLQKILNRCGVIIKFYTRTKNEIDLTINYLLSPLAPKYFEERIIFTIPGYDANSKTICDAHITKEKMKRILNLKAFL